MSDFNSDQIQVTKSRDGMGLTSEEAAEFSAKIVPRDSVVMSCVGRFGITAVLSRDAVINQQLHAFLPSKTVLPRYLAYALRTRTVEMEAASTATTISYLNKEKCNRVRIPLPSMPEQQRIVDCLTTLDDLIAAQTQKLGALKTHKKGLMQQLFPSPTELEA